LNDDGNMSPAEWDYEDTRNEILAEALETLAEHFCNVLILTDDEGGRFWSYRHGSPFAAAGMARHYGLAADGGATSVVIAGLDEDDD
jgi:hypothetical protein